MTLNGYKYVDPVWIYAIGWSVVLLSIVFIIVIGVLQITRQEEYYTFTDVISFFATHMEVTKSNIIIYPHKLKII